MKFGQSLEGAFFVDPTKLPEDLWKGVLAGERIAISRLVDELMKGDHQDAILDDSQLPPGLEDMLRRAKAPPRRTASPPPFILLALEALMDEGGALDLHVGPNGIRYDVKGTIPGVGSFEGNFTFTPETPAPTNEAQTE